MKDSFASGAANDFSFPRTLFESCPMRLPTLGYENQGRRLPASKFAETNGCRQIVFRS